MGRGNGRGIYIKKPPAFSEASSCERSSPQWMQKQETCSTTSSTVRAISSLCPLCPFCPPTERPDCCLRDPVRPITSDFRFSLLGGILLFELSLGGACPKTLFKRPENLQFESLKIEKHSSRTA